MNGSNYGMGGVDRMRQREQAKSVEANHISSPKGTIMSDSKHRDRQER